MPEPWKTRASKILHKDQWLHIRADTCEDQSGQIIEPFYILEYPEWICVLPITADGDVVLTREYRHGVQDVVIGLPGGNVDAEDTSIAEAAAREMREETGYTTKQLLPLGSYHANWANQPNQIHYFLALDAELTDDQALDATEDIDVLTMSIEKLRSADILKQAYHVTCLHLALRKLEDRNVVGE